MQIQAEFNFVEPIVEEENLEEQAIEEFLDICSRYEMLPEDIERLAIVAKWF